MAREEHYNAAMEPNIASWERLRNLPATVYDGLLALGLTLFIVVESALGSTGQSPDALALLMTIPLAWRRRAPLLVFGLVAVGATNDIVAAPVAGLAGVMVAAYSVGAYARYRLFSLTALTVTAAIIVTWFHGGMPPVPDSAGPFIILLPLWFAGNAIRKRQQRADRFEDRAAQLEREGEQERQLAVAEERARIARELHDVVAHSVSVMVVQAGAARQVLGSSPEQANEALRAVETTGREAMTELRSLLGVLSDTDQGSALAPQPGVEQLEPLIERVREAGLPVELCVRGRLRPLPSGIQVTAYRIVQEALTNALKYSGLARTQVTLSYNASGLAIEVIDEGSGEPAAEPHGPGRGLIGMRERAALYGGRLEAGPGLGRGYAVRAWIPTEAP